MAKKLIKSGYLLTMDPRIGWLSKGDILINGSKIEAVDRDLGNMDGGVIDAKGKLIGVDLEKVRAKVEDARNDLFERVGVLTNNWEPDVYIHSNHNSGQR
jgi:hypothetical protein